MKRVVPGSGNVYYGLNVSGQQRYEPVDQLDGFLVAKAMQLENGAAFYPYIAGVYGVFNTTNPKRARKVERQMARREREKAELLANVMANLQLNGEVILSSDAWRDPEYWKLFGEAVKQIGQERLTDRQNDVGIRAMLFGELPKEVLGAYSEVFEPDYLSEVDSAELYLPAEIAETLWLREKKGVGWKIGPESEQLYDTWIERLGIGIVQFRQPLAWDDPDGFDGSVAVSPYQGKERQDDRIFFADMPDRLERKRDPANPSWQEAERLVGIAKS